MAEKNRKNVRLPKHIVPKRYYITLFPNLKEFSFSGEVEILLNLTKPTREITLHAAELKITSAVLHHSSFEFKSQKVIYNEKLETATMLFEKTVKVREIRLKLSFTGILNDKMRGFYRSKYKHDGKDHHMAVTQFESTDARRAIPSFDEPSKKAVFHVKLIIPQDHTAISNTIETEIAEHSPGYKIVTFEPTPKMSTYLLAFIVGKFEHIDVQSKSGVKIRVFTTHGKKHQAKFALSTARKVLEFYENYFGIKYPLPALDLIAIPDFAAGAMENWGAVTYRETALLVDEELTSTANKQWVALVVAHELAHMWFGNLVTMEWWTHLWLNEGFASFIEYLAVDKVFPSWHIWTQFVYMDHSKALDLDGLKNTHPIEVEVHHPSEISEIFDAVSYSKGASIIRMLAEYLGEKDFQKGLQAYLKKHKYSNASTVDLWTALEKVSGKKVKKIMENWTGKPGYPLVEISESSTKLKLVQKRFFSSPISAKTSDNTLWNIPLGVISEKNKKSSSYLFSKRQMFLSRKKGWLKLNPTETSFIRVLYPPNLLTFLEKPVREKVLSPQDRYGLVRDAFMFSQSGHGSTADALRLIQAYENEDNYIVWAEISSYLRILSNLVYKENFYEEYKAFCRKVFRPIVEKVGWSKKTGETHTQTLLRSIVIYGLGTNGDEAIMKKSRELFEGLISGKSKLDSDLRGVVYNLVSENGGIKEYEALKDLYGKTPLQEEKDRIFRALCLFRDKSLLEKSLKMAFSPQMRAQDRFKGVSFVWANPVGRDLAWDFVKTNWESISKTFAGGHLYTRFISPGANFVDSKKALEIEEFFRKYPSIGLDRTIAQVTEQIRANSLWLSRDKTKISTFLQEFN
ncbi:MAG: M1 family metallopeptidase [Candidatus Levybacteria bacterium]|nr:M1 family metallopeptidase [Candidatus Levybacteria bacterium]